MEHLRTVSVETKQKVLANVGFQLGRVLEKARMIKGLTQSELAKKIGSTQSVIAKIESGDKIPSLPFLKKIAEAYDSYLIPPAFGFMNVQATIDSSDTHNN